MHICVHACVTFSWERERERDFIVNLTYFGQVRKTEEETPRYIVMRDELFDIILEAHVSTGHGGGEKKRPREFWMENTAILQAKMVSYFVSNCDHANWRNRSQIRVSSWNRFVQNHIVTEAWWSSSTRNLLLTAAMFKFLITRTILWSSLSWGPSKAKEQVGWLTI